MVTHTWILILALLLPASAQAITPVPHPSGDSLGEHVAIALDQARQEFEAQDAPSAGGWAELGMAYHAHGLRQAARPCYQNAMELAPNDARWSYYLGLLLSEQGDFQGAVDALRLSLDQNPYYLPTRVRLIRARMSLGDTDGLIEQLEDLTARFPAVAAFHADLGQLRRQSGDHAAAVAAFERALQLQPGATALRYPLALSYRDLGEADQARFNMQGRGEQEVIVEDPLKARMMSASRSYSYFLSLGVRAADSGDLDAALMHLTRAREIAPKNVFVLQTLARVQEARGDLNAAIALLDQILSQEPDFALALEHRGILHEIEGDDLSAEVFYERALEKDPGLNEARLLLANVLMRSNRFDSAAGQYQGYLERFPERVEILLRLASARYEAGQCSGAIAALSELLERVPGDPGHFMAFARVVATCPGSSRESREYALNGMRELYRLDASRHVATTLAMIEAANGHFEAAADLQASGMFLMLRDQRQDGLEEMQSVLDGYRSGRLPERPWGRDHAIVHPPRVRIEDRQ